MLIKNLNVRQITWISVSIIVLVFAVYWLKFRPLPVTAFTVTLGELRGEVMGTGTLEARVKTTISPRIQERLAEVFVDQGDTVKAGQLLARLDDAELKQQVAVAEAALAAAGATVARVRTDEARAQAVLQQARLQPQRLAELVSDKAASQEELDKATADLRIAEADLQRSQSAIVEARSQLVTAEKDLQLRREQLAFTELRSPYAGLILRRDRDPGGVVVPGSSILQLIDTDEIWINAWIDETAMAALAVGQPARVVFRSEPERNYPGGGGQARPRNRPRDARVCGGRARSAVAGQLGGGPAGGGLHRIRIQVRHHSDSAKIPALARGQGRCIRQRRRPGALAQHRPRALRSTKCRGDERAFRR